MPDPQQQGGYRDDPRPDVEPFVPTGARSALDVGCGGGAFGATLRRLLGLEARIVGIEAVPESVERARSADRGFDEVVQGYFPAALADRDERFDLITFNDVLEHIVDPWQTLEDCRDHLSAEGQVLAAIPNVQHAPHVLGLLRGRWSYTDQGILDRTHVRFFTRASMVEMFEDRGYEVVSCVGANSLDDLWRTDPVAPRRWAKHALARALGDAAYLHFVVRARPRPRDPSAGRPT